jgi:hypothetical protein
MSDLSEASVEQKFLQYQQTLDEQHKQIVSELDEINQYQRDTNDILVGTENNLDTVCDKTKSIAENTGACAEGVSEINNSFERIKDISARNDIFYTRVGIGICAITTIIVAYKFAEYINII